MINLIGQELFSDDDLLVVNKPAGLTVLPDGYNPDTPYLKQVWEEVYESLWVVHRLDRFTSGVLVFARSPEVHRYLNIQFERRQVEKTYQALVIGVPGWGEKTISLPLRQDGDRKHRTVVDHRYGKSAITLLRVLERFQGFSFIEAKPLSGRTHQIRAHLSASGYPILADGLYGGSRELMLSELKPGYRGEKSCERPLINRMALHARCLEFDHPSRGKNVIFMAPYPKDFRTALRQLRKYRSQG